MIEYDITALLANIMIGIGLGIGLVVFYVWRTIRRFENQMQGLVREAIQEVEVNMIGLIVEQEGDMIYAYTEQDRLFVCQGATVEEIRAGFKSRYPEKTAYLAGGDADLVEHFKQELVKMGIRDTTQHGTNV